MTTSPEQEITYGFETTTTTALMATFSGNASGGGGGSSSNDSAEIVADLRRWPHAFLSWYIAAPGAAIAMIPFGLLTLAVNVITCLALIAERALQTTLYTYLASLAACDVIGAAIITPLAAASLYYDGDSRGTERIGDIWYTLDTFLRTAQLLHFVAASLDAHWQLSGARNLLLYQNKRYFATSGPRHVIPRRSLAPRLLITWLTTAVMALSPFIWYHFVASSSNADGTPEIGRQSAVRKLVLLVFMLSFAMPIISAIAAYGLLLRTWFLARRECSLAVVISKSGLTRTGSTASRRSVRGGAGGLRSRQASVRASRRSRGGGRSHGGGMTSSGVFGGGSGAGGGGGCKSSPQLDRHPSVRYSIRRHGGGPGGRRDGSRTSIDRDSAEASLLADVIAAETAAAMQASFDGGGAASGTALSAMFQQNNATPFGPGGGSRAGSRRESPNSNRSSRSDRGGPTAASGPEVSPTAKQEDPSPTRRFAKQRQPAVGVTGSGATTTDTTTDHRSGSGSTGCGGGGGGVGGAAGVSGVDPYFLLSGLQAAQKRPPLSAQRSNPEVTTFGSPDIVGVDLSPRGSREELVKALVGGGVVKKRSFVRRHSSRARRSHQQPGPDSPRLDRHPSLRYSTTRLQTATSSSSSRGDRHSAHGGGSLFSRRGVASCSTLSVGTARHCSVGRAASTVGTGNTAACVHVGSTCVNRKESSGSNASSSIGTCHDLLQPSASTYSMSRGGHTRRAGRLHLDSTGSSPETDCEAACPDGGGGGGATVSRTASRCSSGRQTQRRSAEDHQALLADRARRNISNVNLLRLAPSDRDVSVGGGPPGVRRNRSAEDFGAAAAAASGYRSSGNRLSPASCRRQRPLTPDACSGGALGGGSGGGGLGGLNSGAGGWQTNSSNHHSHYYRRDRSPSDNQRAVPLDSASGDRYVPHGATDTDRSDVVVAGAGLFLLLVLWLPVLVVELTAALRLKCGGSSTDIPPQCSRSNVDRWRLIVSGLHVVGYIGGLLRPVVYQVFNRTLRLALLHVVCRQ